MGFRYDKGSDVLFEQLRKNLDVLRIMAEAGQEPGLVSAVDEVRAALEKMRLALIEACDHADAQIDEKIDAIEKDDPWAKILSHRK